ncbi:DedA family protein [Bifidobacterium aesculapii]|uniref:DedA family protein n=1 Tax=Bifidobacterium aesculapii TaxID=1329411 RepID=UPI0006E37E94|nr:DedA family protein [Bifidobacterium aesculapii]
MVLNLSAAAGVTTQAATNAPAPVCPTGDGGLIQVITDWLVSLMETVGGVGVALAIALESVFPPIPSEVILPLAGFTASRGTLNLVEAIIWATVGSLLGAWALYGISRWVGLHRIHRAADVIPGVSRKDVNKANDWFTRYGTASVLIGRVIPVVRSLISIPAGFNRMNFLHFTGWTLLGSAVWNTILVSAGYFLGSGWCSILGYLNVFEDVVIVAFIVVIVVWAVRKIRTVTSKRGAHRK